MTDSDGFAVESSAINLTVVAALSGSIVPSILSPTVGQSVTFAANISGGYPPFLYAWAFGDGSGGSGPTAFHTYHDPGNYLVQLWINDSGNGSTELNVTLEVQSQPATFPSTLVVAALSVVAVSVVVLALLLVLRRKKGLSG